MVAKSNVYGLILEICKINQTKLNDNTYLARREQLYLVCLFKALKRCIIQYKCAREVFLVHSTSGQHDPAEYIKNVFLIINTSIK